jgi:hypothetical protein
VAIDDTIILLLFICSTRLRGTALGKVSHVTTLEPVKELISINIFVETHLARLTRHDIEEITFVTAPCALITAHKLSPGFLEESHPELASLECGKLRVALIIVDEEVVNDHQLSDTVEVHNDTIDTAVISSGVDETKANTFGEFSIG